MTIFFVSLSSAFWTTVGRLTEFMKISREFVLIVTIYITGICVYRKIICEIDFWWKNTETLDLTHEKY